MEFIDKLKVMGCETYKYTTEKTNKIAKETKLKMKINQNKSQIEDIYEEIGKLVYQEHIREEKTDIKPEIEGYCKEIDGLCNEIDEMREEVLNLKDKKKCEVCSKEINVEDKFCPQCGTEQSKKEYKEVEIVNENKQEEYASDEYINDEYTSEEDNKVVE